MNTKEAKKVDPQLLNEDLENYFANTIIPQLFVDSELILRKKARLKIDSSSAIVIHGNATISGEQKKIAKLKRKGLIRSADQ